MIYRSILCPIDLSPTSRPAVAVAFALAGTGTVVHLLHVREPAVVAVPVLGPYMSPQSWIDATADEALNTARAQMGEAVPADALWRGVRAETHAVQDGDVVGRIESEARRLEADVVVLGTHGRTGIGRAVMGSVAATVLRRTKLPVILVHEPTPARRRA